jgi:hypothetical protein
LVLDDDAQMAKFDSSPYHVIIFDEIYFTSIKMLSAIKRYADEHPDKIILGTGDTCQLEPIDSLTNNLDPTEYADHCIDTIFPNSYLFNNK